MTEAPHPGRRAGMPLSLIGAVTFLLASAGGTFGAPDITSRLDQYGLDLAAATAGDGIAYFRMIDADLQSGGSGVPGLDLARLTGELTTDALAAELDEQAGLASLQRIAALPSAAAFLDAAAAMIKPLFDLAHSGPENPEGLRNLGKAVERLAAGGTGLSDVSGLKADEYLKIVEQAAKWTKAAADLASLQQTGALNAKQFTDDVLSALPPQIAPGLASPAGKFFRDLMDWDQQMWSTSTDGLDLVSRAISDGKLDTAAYDKVAKRLQALAQQGPWTTQSGIDFAKKMAEGVPTAGKLLKALWSSAAKATLGLSATSTVPLTTQGGGQLPPQTFSFSLGAGGSINVTSSPGFQVYGQGGVRLEFVKLSPDGLPGYFTIEAATVAGGGGEEAHRWQVYPEQQVAAVTVDYDTGTATAVPSGFGASAEPPLGATRVTGIDVIFYPLGATVVLHWPADIPF